MFRLAQTVLDTSRQIRLDTLLEGAKSGAQTGNGTHTHTQNEREKQYIFQSPNSDGLQLANPIATELVVNLILVLSLCIHPLANSVSCSVSNLLN